MNKKTIQQLPVTLQPHFLNRDLDKEGAKLVRDIIKLRKKGIYYDRDTSVRLYSNIIASRGKAYHTLIRTIKVTLYNQEMTHYVDGPDDIVTRLLNNLSRKKGRTWDYETISFQSFTKRAVISIIASLKNKNKPEIIDFDPSSEEPCNIVDYAADHHAIPFDVFYEQQEEISLLLKEIKKNDPIAYKVLKLKDKGYDCNEIAKKLKLTDLEIYNAGKRLVRKASNYFPDRKIILPHPHNNDKEENSND